MDTNITGKKWKPQKTITIIVKGHGGNYGEVIEYPDSRVRVLSKICEGCIGYSTSKRTVATYGRDLPRIIDAYNSSPDPNISTYKKLEFVQELYNEGREKGWNSVMHDRMQFLIDENIKKRDEAKDETEKNKLNNIIKRDTNFLQYTLQQENANAVNKIETFSVDNSVSFKSNEYSQLLDPGIHVIDILNNPDVDKYFKIGDNLAKEKYCIAIGKPELNKKISDRLENFFSNLIRVDGPSRQFTIDKLQNMGIDENTASLTKSTPSISIVCETIKSLKQLYASRDAIIKENNNSPDLQKVLDMIKFKENLLSSLSNRLKIYAYIFLKNLFTTAEQISSCFREYRTNPDKYGFLKDFVPIETDFNDMLISIEQMDVSTISRYDDNSFIHYLWLTSLVEKLQKYGFVVINIILEACRVNFENCKGSYEDYEGEINKTKTNVSNVGNVGVFQFAKLKDIDTTEIGGRKTRRTRKQKTKRMKKLAKKDVKLKKRHQTKKRKNNIKI